ncbi:MAG TPA: LPS export ABC transporter periplasmic protein LptC [Paludibacter sp.]|nr:LPS export ABC transporter periplasmic protein LptC [Paludibacter sp.]
MKNNVTTITTIVVVLFFVLSCTEEKQERIAAIVDRSAMPQLHAMDITTVISDSGITRYRISTPQWDMFDRANPPYWEFPTGVHFERFDVNLNVDANIHSKYAKYLVNEKLWLLKGTVRMTNIKGELFETERLYWNQINEKIYSDTLVKITQAKQIVYALGFESNEQMSKILLVQSKATFAVEDK